MKYFRNWIGCILEIGNQEGDIAKETIEIEQLTYYGAYLITKIAFVDFESLFWIRQFRKT